MAIATDTAGFQQLIAWAAEPGQVIAVGIEGTGSYGQALARFLLGQSCRVVEVNRVDRAARRMRGMSYQD